MEMSKKTLTSIHKESLEKGYISPENANDPNAWLDLAQEYGRVYDNDNSDVPFSPRKSFELIKSYMDSGNTDQSSRINMNGNVSVGQNRIVSTLSSLYHQLTQNNSSMVFDTVRNTEIGKGISVKRANENHKLAGEILDYLQNDVLPKVEVVSREDYEQSVMQAEAHEL